MSWHDHFLFFSSSYDISVINRTAIISSIDFFFFSSQRNKKQCFLSRYQSMIWDSSIQMFPLAILGILYTYYSFWWTVFFPTTA